jgi:RND family efflux transporter MFP subunit
MSAPLHSDTPLPPARTAQGAARIVILGGATVLAIASIVLARAYTRPEPTPEPPPPGMTTALDPKGDRVTLTPDAPQRWSIKSAPARAADPLWSDPIPARIVFDESRTSRLGAPLAGRVTAVGVERGQTVKMGAPLFTVSSPGLAELRAEHDKAMVERTTAKSNYERTQALVDAQSLPAKDLVTAKQQVDEAELAVRLADAKLAALKVGGAGDASFTVVAPRAGVVVEKTVTVGQQVSPDGGSMMAIADLSSVWVVADLFESQVGALKAGNPARIHLTSDTRGPVEGVIDHVSAVVDPERHTVPVRVKLANPEGLLRPNAYAQVRFFDPTGARVTLPASAVMSDGKGAFVFVEQPAGVMTRRKVTVGSVNAGRVSVYDGVAPGELVVTHGANLLDNELALEN